jgi:hypothetical protein
MQEGSYAAQLFAALFFMIAGGRLVRLSQRTGEAPERLLGLYFALTGVAYLGWVLPYVVALGPLEMAADFGAWIIYSIGVVPYLIFTRIVFRKDAHWALWLALACAGALAVSTTMLILQGDEYPGLDNPYYWAQWLGYTVPCAWMTTEASLCHRIAVRRSQVGLSDPIVANRYLLLALFGAFQTLACFSDILVTLDLAVDRELSTWADSALGGCEIAGIAVLWLAFFPPASYLAWLAGSKRAADGAV